MKKIESEAEKIAEKKIHRERQSQKEKDLFYSFVAGLVVRRPPWERKIPGSNPACAGIFSGSSHTSDSKIGTPVATLPGAWRYRVSTGTGRPGVSIQWLGEVERLICNFYLSVATSISVWQHIKMSILGCVLEQRRLAVSPETGTLACCWDVKQPTNNNNFSILGCVLQLQVKMSEQICPWDTLACCWDVKQPTNNNNFSILGCVLQLQEVALHQSLPSFSVLCYPRPYRSLLPHNVISPTMFWSSDWSYTILQQKDHMRKWETWRNKE